LPKDLSRTAQAAFLAIGNGSQTLASLAIAVLLSRLLTKDDYATFRQTFLTYQFCAPLLGLGLPAAVLYFIPREPDRARSTILQILSLTAISGSVFAAFFLLGGAGFVAGLFNNTGLEITLKWFAFYPLLVLPTMILKPLLITQKRAPWITGFSFGEAIVRVIAVAAPMFLIAREPVYAIQGLIAGGLAVLFPTCVIFWRAASRVKEVTEASLATVARAKQILGYGLPMSIALIIGTFYKTLDKLLVSMFETPEVFAAFVNGAMELPFISLITGSAAVIITPEITRLYRDKRQSQAIDLFQRSAQKCAAVLIPVGGGLFLVAPELIVLLYGPTFEDSAFYFRLYLLVLPARAVMYGVLFQAAAKPQYMLTSSILALGTNAGLSVILIILMGPMGAALATIIVLYIVVVPYSIYMASKLYSISPSMLLPYRFIGALCCLVLATATVPWLVEYGFAESKPEFISILRMTIGVCLCFAGGWILYVGRYGRKKSKD